MADGSLVLEPLETDVDGGQQDGGDGEQSTDSQGLAGSQQQHQDDPYSSKASREYSAWLKSLRDSGDPVAAKFARLAKDNHGAQFALRQLDPKGIDGVRERYALMDSVIHTDPERGELHGAEAIAAMQDAVREYAEIDELLAQGDPKALESLGDDFNAGLAKLAPTILDRIKGSDPEGYAAAVLPHFVDALSKSELVSNFNAMVDVLEEKPPSWLTEQQKTAWAADQQRKVVQLAAGMGTWLNAQARKAQELPKPGEPGKQNGTGKQFPNEEQTWRKEQQESHWNTNITPKLDAHAAARFNELFRPYATRLKLDPPTAKALMGEFSKRVAGQAAKDKAYIGQIGRYRAMRNPDPATVVNYAKVNFDKHAKSVMEALVNERYKPFLNAKARPAAPTNGNGAPPVRGVQDVSTKPADGTYDPRARSLDEIHAKIFHLNNGKTVRWVRG
jgi:hypothetical protein